MLAKDSSCMENNAHYVATTVVRDAWVIIDFCLNTFGIVPKGHR